MSSLSEIQLGKQTVAQLMTLCREHKLSGYSKLKKAALIEKLEVYRSKQAAAPQVASNNGMPEPIDTTKPILESIPEGTLDNRVPIPAQVAPSKSIQPIEQKRNDVQKKRSTQFTNTGEPVSNKLAADAPTTQLATPLPHSIPTSRVPPKSVSTTASKRIPTKRTVGHVPDSPGRAPKKRVLNPLTDIVTDKVTSKTHDIIQGHGSPGIPRITDSATAKASFKTGKRRFVALKPKIHAVKRSGISVFEVSPTFPGIFDSYSIQKEYDTPLSNIAMPPPLSQRKRIKGLALILRDLHHADRWACCVANRTLRYAVYVSAQFILYEEFPGQRTDLLLASAQDCLTNLWPYLTFRRQEKLRLKRIYETSFLFQYVPRPMSERIWGNPDRGDEVTLALRFTLSRLWFTVSLFGNSGIQFLEESIVSLERLARDEIWKVSIFTPDQRTYSLFVLSATGEAVGCQDQGYGSRLIRSDWMHHLGSDGGSAKLLDTLRCANEEEFVKGISKSWIRKVEKEGVVGDRKRRVAERYVIASVVANSVSGQQMSHLQMAMQSAGIPIDGTRASRAINLFLSEHHHVESVHFTSTSGQPFHSAIASILTPHREYFILRENGLQIGCEEEGVGEAWMEILRVMKDGTSCL